MTRGQVVPLVNHRSTQGPRMDRIQIYARCNNSVVYFVCPVRRILIELVRIR